MSKEKPEEPVRTHKRPKSAGTINLLVETRRQASDDYARAQRAEKSYRMRKNATIARTTLRETKSHFSQGFKHLGQGFKGLFAVTRAVPYLLGERQDAWRRKSEAKKRMRAEDMRKKLDDKLARKYAGAEDDGEEGEGAEGDKKSEATGANTGKGSKK
ncbi:hypothetical protein F5Y08DRAFT_55703 [Xylaria arbuscula]|uniref:Uncharacterized protein n=1 Tax=Xylaria arbuscula TaxID=114810 RepID=A0A9W8NPC5_9PEZI|nr:hypothetical protein F5Y08DRAFT_55703 [Xylaria arbuscula]KAJ3580078.1 hypothetical protein NPX13_g489 [Xylaria arbuscula]